MSESQNKTTNKLIIIGVAAALVVGGIFAIGMLRNTLSKTGDGKEYKQVDNMIRPWNPVIGKKDSKVKFLYLYDYMCGACQANSDNVKALKAEYKDKVGFVYKTFIAAHPGSGDRMALAALAANKQGKFEEFSDRLIKLTPDKPQTGLSSTELEKLASDVGMDSAKFAKDFNSIEVENNHKTDKKDIENVIFPESKYEVGKIKPTGTPTTMLLIDDKFTDMAWGSVTSLEDSKDKDGTVIKGQKSRIDEALQKAGIK